MCNYNKNSSKKILKDLFKITILKFNQTNYQSGEKNVKMFFLVFFSISKEKNSRGEN